jgi:radical SAM protein with 4Fe4S-binding SPASM domain
MVAEPCESTRFSVYIDVNGDMYPCSFCERIDGWNRGISVDKCQDFVKDVWMDEKVVNFRKNCISCMNMKEACQVYEV